MDYRPVSTRTRSKTLLKLNGELKKSSGVTPASGSKEIRRSSQAYVSRVGESSTRKQSFEWVAGNVEYLKDQQSDDVLESFDSQEGVMMMDSDDDIEVVVSKGKEGGRVGVDVDDVFDCGSDEDVDNVSDNENDEDVSSTEGDDSSDGSVSSSEDYSTEEESDEESDESVSSAEESIEEETHEEFVSDEEYVSSSDEGISEEEKEEETELTGKNEKECKGESVDADLKRKRNDEDDLLCSQGTDVISEQVKKEELLEDFIKRKIYVDGDVLHFSLGHDRSYDYKDDRMWKKEQSDGVGSKENRTGDVRNQCKYTEGDSSFTKKKSSRAPKQKRVPTVAFQPPKVEGLPLRFSFANPQTIPEKSDYDIEVEKLLAEYKSAMAYDIASTDYKVQENNFTRSDNDRNHVNDETYDGSSEKATNNGRIRDLQTPLSENEAAKGNDNEMHSGTSESGFAEGSKFDVQSVCKKGVEAKRNHFSRSMNTGKDDNGETYDGSHPESYKKKAGFKKLTNKKGGRAPKECNAFSILLDSIYDKEEETREKLPHFGKSSLKDEAPKYEAPRDTTLPLFFTFGPPPSPPPEKSDFEIEIDNLFDEYNLVGISGEIGSTDFNVVETNDSLPPGKEVTQHVLCSQGKHDLVLDEEIGLVCQFCPHVQREIKYILPEFAPNPYGKYGKRFYEEDNQCILDDLQCNDHNNSGISFHSHTEGTVWDLIPGVESDMYPHQRDGFEFIWRHIAGGTQLKKLAQPSDYAGDGCIISHAPGTGKTRLTIFFIQSYMKFNPSSRPLIVAPRTMLLTWQEEFKKWGFDIPFHNLNNPDFTGKEDEAARNLVKDGKRSEMTNLVRLVKLKSWAKTRSILGISYSLFEQICGVHTKRGKHPLSPRRGEEAEQMSKVLLEFPGLVVFDEGHNPRNEQSYSWNTLLKLKTRRRILLSGTPFQNSFEELYNTVRLVRPEWTTNLSCPKGFDKKQWHSYQMRHRKSNARKGQFADDDNSKRAREVRNMISPFVHVYKGIILQDKLPGLRNSVVILQPTALQQRYLDRIQKIRNTFKYEVIEARITIHPSLLLNEERSMFFEEDEYSSDWNSLTDWESLTELKLNPECGVKARFVIDLICLCQATNERVLVFSQWVDPLYLIRDLLISQFRWVEGVEIIYMDGKCDAKQRQYSMSNFNDPSTKAKVLLATTRGCNEGISLVGASRVVLLDVAWNPSVERQAISRAYRLGQKKIVSIYHLLMAGTREEDKYSRQVEKHRLSELVFSCSNREAAKKIPPAVAEDKILEEMVQHHKLKHIFQQITLLDEASYLDENF